MPACLAITGVTGARGARKVPRLSESELDFFRTQVLI